MRPLAIIAAVLVVAASLFAARSLTAPGKPPAPQVSGPARLGTTWTVRLDPAGTGARRSFQRGRFGGQAVKLPYSPNAKFVTGTRGQVSYDGSVAWYRTTLSAPSAGEYALDFESVNHLATVWIDGRLVARHTGTYIPFRARAQLARGSHTVVVRADWRNPSAMKRAGWHRTWFNFGGINRPVTLVRLGAAQLDSPGIVTHLDHGAAVVDVTVREHGAGAVTGSLGSAPLHFHGVHARVRIAHPHLWSPAHPTLYPLTLSVPGQTLRVKTGLREITWKGTTLRLNGSPLKLRGASLQEDAEGRGDALLPADMDAIVNRLKALHANVTRAQHPLSPELLDRLDAAGILVWQGVGQIDQPGRFSGDIRTALSRARQNVLAARIHPSELTWMVVNEIDANGVPAQRAYVEEVARQIRALDSGRPISVDIWGTHLPPFPGPVYRSIDLIGATNYEGWYADLFAPGAAISAHIRGWLARLHALFPAKPLVVTEFGAEGDSRNAPNVPGGLQFQANLIARHIAVYEADPRLTGMLVWNLQDFAMRPSFFGGSVRGEDRAILLRRGINEKGLYTYGGRPKPAARVVAKLFSRPRGARAAAG